MKRTLLAIALVLLATTFVAAQDAKLGGHDIKINYNGTDHYMGCKSCHAPHNGARWGARVNSSDGSWADPGTVWGGTIPTTSGTRVQKFEVGQYKLWDKFLPSGAFDLYSSDNVAPGTLQPASATDTAWHSYLCLSCHDGATGSQNIPGGASGGMNVTNRDINGNIDIGLKNDHPINVAWPDASNTEYVAAATVKTSFPLYGSSNMLQCTSCHNPHDEGTSAFLRADYESDHITMCRSCHVK
jgi:predicted CXXCH cytochrome family protein